jgi:hypothetical protein
MKEMRKIEMTYLPSIGVVAKYYIRFFLLVAG